jgi:hypothetical protein
MSERRGSDAYLPRSAWALVVALVCAGGGRLGLAQTPPAQNPPGGTTSSDTPEKEKTKQPGAGNASGPNEFHLDLTAGARSNSNAFFDPVDGSPQHDYVGTLVADLSVRRSSPRTAWNMDYIPVVNHYQTFSELDSTSHALNFAGRYRMGSRGGLNLQEHFTLSNDPVVVSAPQEGDAPILTNTSRVLRNRAEVKYDHEMSRTSHFNIGATHILNRYADGEFQDSDGVLGQMAFDFALGRQDSLGVTVSGGRLQFDQEGISDVTSSGAALNWSHATERSRLELSGGATVADQNERETFFSGSASYHQRLGRSAEVGGGWRRSLTADIGNDGAAVGDRIFATISGRVGRHVALLGSADYGTRESAAGANPVNLDLWGGSFRATFSMGPRWGLVAGANVRRQETVEPSVGAQNVNNYWLGVSCRAF